MEQQCARPVEGFSGRGVFTLCNDHHDCLPQFFPPPSCMCSIKVDSNFSWTSTEHVAARFVIEPTQLISKGYELV